MEQMSTAELVEILEKYDEQGITHERGLIVEEDRMSLTNDTRTAKGD